MKRVLLFFVIAMFCATAFGQLAEVEKTAIINQKTAHFNFLQYLPYVVSDDEQQMTIYISPLFTLDKWYHHTLLTYDKKSQKISTRKLTLPEEHKLALGFDAGDEYFFSYLFKLKKGAYYYCPTHVAKKGSSSVKPSEKIHLNSKYQPRIWQLHSKSNKMHAIIIEEKFKRKEIANYKVFVYDSLGNEVSNHDFKPYNVREPILDYEAATLSEDGEVSILFGGYGKRYLTFDTYYLALVGGANNGEEYRIPFPQNEFKLISTNQFLLLENGKHFIGIFTTDNKEKYGCYSLIFDRNSDDIVTQNYSLLPDECQLPKSGRLETVKACELDNGTIALLGDFQSIAYGRDDYRVYTCKDIVCQMLNQNGECQEVQHIVKSQKSFANRKINPVLIGLSFTVEQKGNDLYLIYTDNIKEGEPLTLSVGMGVMLAGTCTRMTRISPEGIESQMLFQNKEIDKLYTGNWNFDGNNFFLILQESGGMFSFADSYITKVSLLK